MKSFFIVAILLAVSIAVVVVNANLPAVCKDPESVYSHNAGHVWDMKATCGRYKCNDLGYVEEEKCPESNAPIPPNCSLIDPVANSTYPNCCPQYRCRVRD